MLGHVQSVRQSSFIPGAVPVPAVALSPPSPSGFPDFPKPTLARSARLFSASAVSAVSSTLVTTDSGQQISLVQWVKDLLTQTKNFKMHAQFTVPVAGLSPDRTVTQEIEMICGESGQIETLRVIFNPQAGPITPSFLRWLIPVPILGRLVSVKALEMTMNPKTRHIEGKLSYMGLPPITVDLNDRILEEMKFSKDSLKGDGYDLTEGVPPKPWQLLEMVLKHSGGTGAEIGLGQIRPDLAHANIQMEAEFKNEEISLMGLTASFWPGAGSKKIEVSGSLLEPTITVYGAQALSFNHAGARIAIRNTLVPEPLVIHAKKNPGGKFPYNLEIPHYKSQEVVISRTSGDFNLEAHLLEGVEVTGLNIKSDAKEVWVEAKEVVAKQLSLVGSGARVATSPGDEIFLENVKLGLDSTHPYFSADVTGNATGQISYFLKDEEMGFMKFNYLEGKGGIWIGRGGDLEPRVELYGQVATLMPELRLMVKSDQMKGSVQTTVTQASLAGWANITVWPAKQEALFTANEPSGYESVGALHVQGKGGTVVMKQDPSLVTDWAELRTELGPLADELKTDIQVDVHDIAFDVKSMRFKSVISPITGKPSLEIAEAEMGDIFIRGDMTGVTFVRLPLGYYEPFLIETPMKDTVFKVQGIQDTHSETGERVITFKDIYASGIESSPTFSPKDQARCKGNDRQRFEGHIGHFQFSPDRRYQMDDLSSNFHLVIKNHLGGGCHIIE